MKPELSPLVSPAAAFDDDDRDLPLLRMARTGDFVWFIHAELELFRVHHVRP
jgi:hypothetical protein